jgi:hypothetical protein
MRRGAVVLPVTVVKSRRAIRRRWIQTHTIDRTVRTAPAAAARLYLAGRSSVRTKICVVSVSRPVGWPSASGTPNSPAAETKTMIAPDRMPGSARGKVTRRTTDHTPQPAVRAASSRAASIRRSGATANRYMYGT